MKTKIFKGIGITFTIGFCLLCSIGILQQTNQNARSYSGYYEAESLTDAYAYQQKINEAALIAGAAILESNIRMTSPPKYTFEVVMLDSTPFEYGEVLPWGSTTWYTIGFAFTAICLLVMAIMIEVIIKGFPQAVKPPENKES